MGSIAGGAQDAVWQAIANNLKRGGRQDSVVRIAWECNLADWRHGATSSTAADYRAMFRRVATVLKATCPTLVIDWGLAIGSGLRGSNDRLAPLTELYPGDDVVDVIHGDTYDFYATQVRGGDTAGLYRTPTGVGLDDLADFARAHGKGLGLGEWGLHRAGGGDNPAFIRAVWAWCRANADRLVYESYFDEPADYIRNSLNTGQNPQAAAQYCRLVNG